MTYPPTNPEQPYSGQPQPGYESPAYPPQPQPGYGTPGYPPQPQPGYGTPGYPPQPQPGYGTPSYPPAPAPPSMPQVYVPPQWQNATPTLNYQLTDRVEKGVTQLALLSMIAGIASIPFYCSGFVTDGWPVFPALIGIVAVVLGHLALAQPVRAGVSRNNGLAITGLVFGYLSVAISLVWIMLKLYAQSHYSVTVT
jgi:hypothetical protein